MVDRRSLMRLIALGFVIFLFSYIGYATGFAWGYDENHARALGLTCMVMAQMAVIPAELGRRRLKGTELARNRRLLWITALAITIYLAVIYVPGAYAAAKLSPLNSADWAIVLASAGLAYLVAEGTKLLNPPPSTRNLVKGY